MWPPATRPRWKSCSAAPLAPPDLPAQRVRPERLARPERVALPAPAGRTDRPVPRARPDPRAHRDQRVPQAPLAPPAARALLAPREWRVLAGLPEPPGPLEPLVFSDRPELPESPAR